MPGIATLGKLFFTEIPCLLESARSKGCQWSQINYGVRQLQAALYKAPELDKQRFP